MLFSQTIDSFANTLERFYPIGAIYISVDSTNPVNVFGFGTWVAFGAGRAIVGVDPNDSDFNAAEKLFGTKTHTLVTGEMPVHNHGVTDPGHNHTQNSHTHPSIQVQGGTTASNAGTHIMTSTATGGSSRAATSPELANAATATNISNTTGISTNNAGSGSAHNNVQPSIAVYLFKRTA